MKALPEDRLLLATKIPGILGTHFSDFRDKMMSMELLTSFEHNLLVGLSVNSIQTCPQKK